MIRILTIFLIGLSAIHGLIHLMGFAAYWPLVKINELPYKTSLLGGRLEVGPLGMKVYSLLWLLAALGFILSAILLAMGKPAWAPLMLVAALLSLLICILDWSAAFRGAFISLALLLVAGVVIGLTVAPAPFRTYQAPADPVHTIPIPAGLPEPVERFYHLTYGDQVPVYHSAVITGRGTARFMGVTMPARMRFTYNLEQGYHHYIETTFFGLPILKVNEHFLDGHSRLVLPFGVVENDLRTDSAANQGLWAEVSAFPAVMVTDPRVCWEPVDETTARLCVPFAAGATHEGQFNEPGQVFTVQFDQQTGQMIRIETLRYRDTKGDKLRWWGDIVQNETPDGLPTPLVFKINWGDESSPWLVYQIEDAAYNVNVSSYIRQPGP